VLMVPTMPVDAGLVTSFRVSCRDIDDYSNTDSFFI
jgi:hypothetical protein